MVYVGELGTCGMVCLSRTYRTAVLAPTMPTISRAGTRPEEPVFHSDHVMLVVLGLLKAASNQTAKLRYAFLATRHRKRIVLSV